MLFRSYDGIDVAHALYDWAYARQMLYIRTLEATGETRSGDDVLDELFGPRFLERRPLLDAISCDDPVPPVLLIDEIDRADDEFEAYLLEILSDFQVTIPEIGTIKAERRPVVFLTSNRTRELHEALKRRCLYMWVEMPDLEREIAIVRARVPEAPQRLAAQAAAFVHEPQGRGHLPDKIHGQHAGHGANFLHQRVQIGHVPGGFEHNVSPNGLEKLIARNVPAEVPTHSRHRRRDAVAPADAEDVVNNNRMRRELEGRPYAAAFLRDAWHDLKTPAAAIKSPS